MNNYWPDRNNYQVWLILSYYNNKEITNEEVINWINNFAEKFDKLWEKYKWNKKEIEEEIYKI